MEKQPEEEKQTTLFGLLVQLSRPALLPGGIGLTFLGAGIARYLGHTIDWNVFGLGLLWVLFTQLAAQYLNEYFNHPADQENPNRTAFSGWSGVLGEGEDKLQPQMALSAFVAALSFSMAIVLSLFLADGMNLINGSIMGLIMAGALAYSIPPIQFARSGSGEFVVALTGGYLVPMLAFSLQTGEPHRLVVLSALPIVLLLVVFLLAVSFPNYATYLKHSKRTFLIRAGWENTMTVHNTLILTAFIALASLWFFEFPRSILLPAYLALPLGLMQFWQMRQIGTGAKPNWKALTLNAAVLVGTLIFLLAYMFWTR